MAAGNNASRYARLPRDPLFRLLTINGLAGVFVALLVLAGIFWANIGNLRVLVLNAEDPFLPVIMLAFGLIITLGSVVIGSAVMLLGDSDGGKGTPRKLPRLPFGQRLRMAPASARSGARTAR